MERLRGRESPFDLKGKESLRMFEWKGLRDCRWMDFNLRENVCCF